MKLRWSSRANADVARLHDFLALRNPAAAARATLKLVHAPERLLTMQARAERVEGFLPREVRRIIVDDYEIQYEIRGDEILVLRIWHTRENR